MGQQVDYADVKAESFEQFTRKLLQDFKALELMLEKGMVESGVERIGAEQELCLVNRDYQPAPLNMEILELLEDPHVVTEYARFNLEVNLDPQKFEGGCFKAMEAQLREKLRLIALAAEPMDARIILTGILPTLRQRDLCEGNMTPLGRYRALNENLTRLRGGRPFYLSINGADELLTQHESSLLESCNTSFQVHLQVSPDDFVDRYNFAQLVSAPLLSAANNSSLLFGKRLWRETRIALFQQSIDTRSRSHSIREQSPRVSFGKNWITQNVTEIFKDNLARHRFIMHADTDEDSLAELAAGRIPKLKAMNLFNGTVYPWNRACYGISNGKPHLRIENRVLPAGPSVVDEMANAAFWLGMMKGMPDDYRDLSRSVRFDESLYNFFKAAKMGLDTQFVWLDERVVSASDLILQELLPMAREGLRAARIDHEDVDRLLGTVEERVKMRHTGGLWMLESFNKMLSEGTRYEAAVAITASIERMQREDAPVHTWELARMGDSNSWRRNYGRIEQIMTTDLYTVGDNDLVTLAAHIMDWKHIRHVPVEDEEGKLVGLIDSRCLLQPITDGNDLSVLRVNSIMVRDPITIPPDMSTLSALELMAERKDSCLLVMEKGKLVGMVTENDFARITANLLHRLDRGGS